MYFALAWSVTLPSHTMENQIKFQWGTNFKYMGEVSHNLARVWIVTKLKLPRIEDISFPSQSLLPQCNFQPPANNPFNRRTAYFHQAVPTYNSPHLNRICKSSWPLIRHIKQKELIFQGEIRRLLRELYTVVPEVSPAGRTKRFAAAVPAIAGLITLAFESLNNYLQRKRADAMATAMDALHKSHTLEKNRLHRVERELLMYGELALNSTEGVIQALEEFYENPPFLEKVMRNTSYENWSEWYINEPPAGSLAMYATEIALYVYTLGVKYNDMYVHLIRELQDLLIGFSKLSRNFIPPELISPTMLENFTRVVIDDIKDTHPEYRLALDHISWYYDLKLASFGVDDSTGDVLMSFPILIKPEHATPYSLYQIETVPFPVPDQDPTRDSFTKVQITKPYIAVTKTHYIQLSTPELHMCKMVQNHYYCEELFTVRHASQHTCESALFYNADPQDVMKVCDFTLYLNTSVLPSVLDGGSVMLLANVDKDKSLQCIGNHNIKLPEGSYVMANRSILCQCSINSGYSYIQSDVAACKLHTDPPKFMFTVNRAVYETLAPLQDTLTPKLNSEMSQGMPSEKPPMPFNLSLNKTLVPNGQIKLSKLRENLLTWQRELNRSKSVWNNTNYTVHFIRLVQETIEKDDDLSWTQQKLVYGILACYSFLTTCAVAWLILKYKQLRVLVTAMALTKNIPLMEAFPLMTTTLHPPPNTVVCQDYWLSMIIAITSVIGIFWFLCKKCRNLTICKGYLFNKRYSIYLFVTHDTRYVPIKLKTFCGSMHNVLLNTPIHSCQIRIESRCLWDILYINWNETVLKHNHLKLHMPQTLAIPLLTKLMLRSVMRHRPYEVHLMAKQGKTWLDLESTIEDENLNDPELN